MKINKILKIIFLVFVVSIRLAFGQSGLQFSQIILVKDINQTVPSGMVWKVESILSAYSYPIVSNCTSISNSGNYGTALFIDNNIYYSDISYHAGTTYSSIMFNGSRSFPLWLPAGTNLKTACSTSLATVVEFKIVP